MEENTSRKLDDMIKEERLRETAGGVGRKARFARHALRRKTAAEGCPQGHAYDEENTLYNAAGRRMCLACLRSRRLYEDRASNPRSMKGPVIDLSNPHQVRNDKTD